MIGSRASYFQNTAVIPGRLLQPYASSTREYARRALAERRSCAAWPMRRNPLRWLVGVLETIRPFGGSAASNLIKLAVVTFVIIGCSCTGPAADGRSGEGEYGLAPFVRSAAFDRMLGFSMIPGEEDSAVVVTQNGKIWRVSITDRVAPSLFGDVSSLLTRHPENEEGLLGLAFSPEFESDRRVYVYYSAGDPRRGVLSRFLAQNGSISLDSQRILLEVPQTYGNHNGGEVVFGPDGFLYLSLGDGEPRNGPGDHAQPPDTLLGSILRLDVSRESYAIPADNPFARTSGIRTEIYAYGLRNPWRFSFDRQTGELWTGDVGQDAWEEVDHIIPGGNFGWSVMEGPACYKSVDCDTSGLIMPVHAYPPEGSDCAVIGGYIYRGEALSELDGWYVYADFCSGRISAFNANSPQGTDRMLVDSHRKVSSFSELPDGELVVVTFDNALYVLSRN